jgi:hypothetical protein
MKTESIHSMLASGRHRLSLGRTTEVVALVLASPRKASRLIECLWDEDPGLRCRAADALERLSRLKPSILASTLAAWKEPLLALLAEAKENKLRWGLAGIVPRLALTARERRRALEIFESWLEDRSSIVKTCALQAIADLALKDPGLLPQALDLLRIHGRSGTAAMRARCRQLLPRLESLDRLAARPAPPLD